MGDGVVSLFWNERRRIVQSRSLIKLNSQLDHLAVRDYSFVHERLLQFDREVALLKHVRKLLLGEILQVLVDQELHEVVGVVEDAGQDLSVELLLGQISGLPCVKCLLIEEITLRV